MDEGQQEGQAPECYEELHAAAAGGDDPRGEHGGNEVDAHQHVDEPEMAYFGAVVDGDLGDVEEEGLESICAARVEVEGVDDAPDYEGDCDAGEALLEELALAGDGEEEEAGDHDEEGDADAEEGVGPGDGPGAGGVEDGAVGRDVFKLAGVDLHDHVDGDDAEEIEAAMAEVSGMG